MPDDALINDREVARVYGVSRATVWNWARRGLIPQPRKMPGGRLSGWLKSEVMDSLRNLQRVEMKEMAS